MEFGFILWSYPDVSEFIALCNFTADYLYETDLYTIIEAINAKLHDYLIMTDTIPAFN